MSGSVEFWILRRLQRGLFHVIRGCRLAIIRSVCDLWRGSFPKMLGIFLTLCGVGVFVYNVFDPVWHYPGLDSGGVRAWLAIGAVLVVAGVFSYLNRPKP